jgi:serine/threonine-protein kinase RsbW
MTSPGSLRLVLELAPVPASVAEARAAIRGLIGGAAVDHHAVLLAVSEAVTNAVRHAYGKRPDRGRVRVTAELEDDRLHVRVTDWGRGLGAPGEDPGAGFGLPLIERLTDELDIRTGPGTRVHMQFAVGGE